MKRKILFVTAIASGMLMTSCGESEANSGDEAGDPTEAQIPQQEEAEEEEEEQVDVSVDDYMDEAQDMVDDAMSNAQEIVDGAMKEGMDNYEKAMEDAKRNMVSVSLNNDTLWYSVMSNHGASKVYMQPASQGTGIIAGGAMR